MTYLIKGSGSIVHGGLDVVTSPSAIGIWLLTTTNTGILKWVLPLKANFQEDELDMTYGDSLGLYIGLAFRDSLKADERTWLSHGGKDVWVAKIKSDGTLFSGRSFGSADDEVIKKVFFNSGYLFLGGDYFGATSQRFIGRNKFINLGGASPTLQKAYMTFVTDNDLLLSFDSLQTEQSADRRTKNTQSAPQQYNVRAFPNPFKDELTVQITGAADNYDVRMFDVLGNLLTERKVDLLTNGTYEIKLDQFGRFTPGVYFVQVTGRAGFIKNLRVVRE